MKSLIKLISTLALFIIAGCTKSLELDIVESKCKNFRISNASSEFTNPNCTKDINSNTLKVNFQFSGDEECLESIHMIVKFYDDNNNVINPISLTADSLNKTSPKVKVSNGQVSFDIDFTMASNAEYEKINYITVNFNTQNRTRNESNKLAVVKTSPCTPVLPPPTATNGTIQVKDTTITVAIWDNAAEDGDIITIIVNGEVKAANVEIFHAKKTFKFTISSTTQNYISFYAVNEGTSSPNTASGTVYDGNSTQSFNVGMKQGESYSFNLVLTK
jgi:hypothetical protein